MRSTLKTILNYHYQSDQVLFVTKTKKDNYVTDRKDEVYVKKTKLRCHDLSDHIRSIIKTRQDNNMINRLGLVYIEIET